MAGKKTIDGIKLTRIVKMAKGVGIDVRDGSRHPYVLSYSEEGPCPVATSTHAERMVAPWLSLILGVTKREAYQAIQRGYWPESVGVCA